MDPVLTLLAAAAAKATAVLLLAGLVTAFWRSASASSRHLVWTTAIISALVIPLAGIMLAEAGLPRLAIPAWKPVVTVTADIAPLAEPVSDASLPVSVSGTSAASAFSTAAGIEPVVVPEAGPIEAIESPVTARIELPALAGIVASSVMGDWFAGWRTTVMFIWAAGLMLALLPLLVGVARVQRISRNAHRGGERWTRLMRETPAIAHLASRVRVLESGDTSMPMTWGILRPTLLVPAGTEEWPEWKCRNILLHELAHVERRDCLTQLLANLACAVYWFNPLLWLAAHRMRVERELACDDRVISAGSPAHAYAQNLLDVARSLKAPSFTSPTAIAMARPSQLSGRLLAVLDARRNRRGVNRSTLAGASFAALALIVTLASVTTRAAIAAEAPSREPAEGIATPASTQPGAGTAEFLPTPLAIVHATQGPSIALTPSAASSMMSGLTSVISGAATASATAANKLAATPIQGGTTCWTATGDGKSSVSIHDNGSTSGGSWTVKYTRDNCSLELRAEGTFRLRADLRDLESLSRGGWFRIEERDGRASRRIDIRNDGNGLERSFWVNGDRATYDAAAQAWFASTLLEVERRTAFSADTRVPELYRTAGLAGVLSEISMMRAAHPKSRYYGELLQMDVKFNTNTLNEVVRRASTDLVSSDYYMSQVLGKLADYPSANEATWRTFAEAAGRMKSDYYKATVLKKVLNSGRLGNETVGVMLRSASDIKSDHYLTDLLKSVASKYALNDDTRAYYAQALSKVKSDYYRAELLRTMNTSGEWDPRTTAFVLTSVSDIKSDYHKSQSLVSLVKAGHVADWRAYFSAASAMESDHYRKETLLAALRHEPLTKEIVSGVINSAARIKSSHAAAEVLSATARSYRLDDQLRSEYERAAGSITSKHYRTSALAELSRSASR
ncbi:MAG: M56 family metallopeptidase [Gemmatimonadaceae bacterium]